jgi:hypothetical protein
MKKQIPKTAKLFVKILKKVKEAIKFDIKEQTIIWFRRENINLILGPSPNIFFNFNNSLSSGMNMVKKIKIDNVNEKIDMKRI